jgi:hypothetical protein
MAPVWNIFVIGLDEFNRATLRTLPDASRYRFQQLLSRDELHHGETIPVRDLLEKAAAQLSNFDGTVDAVIGYWDFPVTQLVPILCAASDCARRPWRRCSSASTSTGAAWSSARPSTSTHGSPSSTLTSRTHGCPSGWIFRYG